MVKSGQVLTTWSVNSADLLSHPCCLFHLLVGHYHNLSGRQGKEENEYLIIACYLLDNRTEGQWLVSQVGLRIKPKTLRYFTASQNSKPSSYFSPRQIWLSYSIPYFSASRWFCSLKTKSSPGFTSPSSHTQLKMCLEWLSNLAKAISP